MTQFHRVLIGMMNGTCSAWKSLIVKRSWYSPAAQWRPSALTRDIRKPPWIWPIGLIWCQCVVSPQVELDEHPTLLELKRLLSSIGPGPRSAGGHSERFQEGTGGCMWNIQWVTRALFHCNWIANESEMILLKSGLNTEILLGIYFSIKIGWIVCRW